MRNKNGVKSFTDAFCQFHTITPHGSTLAKVPFWYKTAEMGVIARKRLVAYWEKHRETEQPSKAWHDEAIKAHWKTPHDVKNQYAAASFLANNRVVFNIKGNDHRLIVAVAYKLGVVYIKFVGTHADYDRVDAATVEME